MIKRKRGTRRLPKESRTLRRKGSGEESGKFYDCWYCGFINKVGRSTLGDSQSRSGLNYVDYSVASPGATGNGDIKQILSIWGNSIEHYHVSLELDSNGDPKPITHVLSSSISSGCPLCGSKNWRGDFP